MTMLEVVLSAPSEESEVVLGPFTGLGVEPRLAGEGVRVFDGDGREVARMIGRGFDVEWREVRGGLPFGRVWWRMDIRPVA